MDLARDSAVSAAAQAAAAAAAAASGHQDEETVYVEAPEDLANVTVASVAGQPGLHLTTITVAVPHPLSPSEVLQQHVVTSGSPQVTLPTVPAPQETAVRWKYEQNKSEKSLSHPSGSSLVSQSIDDCLVLKRV